jgi:hypothetical protein
MAKSAIIFAPTFKGCIDGDIYPTDFEAGDEVYGELADAAIAAGAAYDPDEDDAPPPAKVETVAPAQVKGKPGRKPKSATALETPAEVNPVPTPAEMLAAAEAAAAKAAEGNS